MTQNEKRKPVHEIRLGMVKAAIWANTSEKGGTRHSVTASRLFKTEKDKQWRFSDTFGRDDLPILVKVLDLAHLWILQQGQAPKEPAPAEQTPTA